MALLSIAAASAGASGCGGTCATNCPAILFDVYAMPGETLNIATALLAGPGCPAGLSGCRGDSSGQCVGLTLIATQPGRCELDVTFSDSRAPLAVQTEFGPETHQGCCHGLPVIGPQFYVVPPLHPVPGVDAGADGADAGKDATPGDVPDAPGGDTGDDAPGLPGSGDA